MLPSLWETVKCDFKGLFPEDVFHMWFEPMVCLESTEEQMTLGVPNDFAAIWIHDSYLDLITQRLRLTSGRMITVTLKKTDSAAAPNKESGRASNTGNRWQCEFALTNAALPRRGRICPRGSLNARNTFETFVVGSNNQMAHAAAMAVAQSWSSPTTRSSSMEIRVSERPT